MRHFWTRTVQIVTVVLGWLDLLEDILVAPGALGRLLP